MLSSTVTTTAFNPLTAARDLEDAGFERLQAEATSSAMDSASSRTAKGLW